MGILFPTCAGEKYRSLAIGLRAYVAGLFLSSILSSVAFAVEFDIPAQSLPQALKKFSQKSGVQFMFLTRSLRGKTSTAVVGDLSNEDALSLMLQGTGLQFKATSKDTVTIKPVTPSEGQEKVDRADLTATSYGMTFMFEEILVTARRRQERLVDVPVSLTALSGDFLATSSAFSIEDIASMVPNLLVINLDTPSSTLFLLRGYGSDTTNPGLESGVAVYKDSVYLGRSSAFSSVLLDLERVEVLRGPQGTLYGRNSILGAFNIISRRPTGERQGQIDLGVGNYNFRRGSAILNIPVSDRFRARFSGIYSDVDGYLLNTVTGRSTNDRKNWGGRLYLSYEASDALGFDLIIDGQSDRSDGISTETTSGPDNREDLIARRIEVNEGQDNRDIWGLGFTARYATELYSLTSITGYREAQFNFLIDGDQTGQELIRQGRRQSQHQFSEELRLETSPSDRLRWTLGVYYFTQYHTDGSLVSYTELADAFPFAVDLSYGSREKNNSYAAFASSEYDLTARWSISAGIRYTNENKVFDFHQTVLPFDLGEAPFINVEPFSAKQSWGAWSPSFVVSYAWAEDINSYVKFVRGFKSGGFNASFSASSEVADFNPEYISSYEVGLKAILLDKRLSFNIAGFYFEYTDQQTNSIDFDSGKSFVVNEGESAGLGFEIDVTAKPLTGLDITASASFFDVNDEQGPEEANRPKWTGSLAAQYGFMINDFMDGLIRADLQYRSMFHSTRTHIFDNPASVLLNMRFSLKLTERNWELYLWGRNLTNQTIFSNTVPGNPIRSNLEAPRTWGVGGKVTF